nr:MAG TPA: tail protein [Caudoviricetes sp.]
MNKEIAVYDNTVSARTYLSYIAEQAGGIAVIGRDGKLYIKTIGESSATLPLKLFKTFKWGEKFKITRVRYDDGTQLFEKGDTTGNTVYISQDNMYIVDQEQIDNIYNVLKDLEFYSFEGESIIDPALDTGDIVVIDGKNVIYQGSMQFSGRWIANIESKIQCKAKEETTRRIPSQKTINRRVESNINQIDGKITRLTEETTENSQKITKTEQDVNGLTTKVSSLEKTTVNKVQVQYALGDTLTTPPTAGWSETAPEWQAGKYMWQKTVTTYSDGATKESKATCIQGAKGETGASGTDGKDGTNGTNGKNGNDGRGIASTVITYQASSSGTTTPTGTWQSTIPTVTAGHYLWTKTVINYTSGEPTTSYSVSMMGKTGANGKNGTSISITSKSVTYQIGTSGTTTPTGTWSTSVPTLESGKYLWAKTYVKYSDSSETTSYAVSYCAKDGVKGDKGATGKGIKSIQDQYYLSTSNTTQTGGAWKNTQDAWESGKYIWTRSHITWSDDTTTDTTPILAESLNTANENAVLAQEKTAEQKIEIDSIKQTVSQTQTTVANNYTEIKQKFGDYAPKSDVITLQNSVERIQTDTYTKTEINTKLTDGSVTKVTTTCGTFDENGLTIEKTNAKTKGNFNEKGMKVVDATGSSEEILLFAGYDEETDETIVKSKNMTVEKYLTIGANCRFEDYVNPVLGGKGTGAFTL